MLVQDSTAPIPPGARVVRVELPILHAGQQRIKDNARRFNVVSCGRRFGKTMLGKSLLVEMAIHGWPVAWFSPTYRMLSEEWRTVRDLLRPLTKDISEQEHHIVLHTKGSLDFWSLDAGETTRGRKYKRVVLDEAGMDPDLLAHWNGPIRPTLADMRGDAFFLSTPQLSGFDQLCQRAESGDFPDWAYFEAPTADNPSISADEIADMRQDMSENEFAREILAKRTGSTGRIFRYTREAATAVPIAEARKGKRYVMGIDWGKMNDFSVFSVLEVNSIGVEQVALERFNQIDYHVQVGRLRILCERFRPGIVVAERNSIGEPIIEQARAIGVPIWPWTATNQSVSLVVEALSLAFERRLLKILGTDHPNGKAQLSELEQFTTEKTPSGLIRYTAPEGVHDDVVRALALSWLAACQPTGRIIQREFEVVGR